MVDVERWWKLAGLLVVLVFVGVLGIAIDKSPSINAPPSSEPHSGVTDRTSSNEPGPFTAAHHSNEPPTENIVKRSESIPQAKSPEGIIVRKVTVLSIDASQASDASALVPNPVSEGPSNSALLPTTSKEIETQR